MIRRLLIQNLVWTCAISVLLFVPAGTLHWSQAWVFVVTMAMLGVGCGLWLAKSSPALLAERLRPTMQREQPTADKAFMVAFGVIAMTWFIVIGLDARYHGSNVPIALQATGFALLVASTGFIMWVFLENAFAAPVVKLQLERGHTVISTGAYAWIRHPMYSGVIVFFIGVALLLGSWWGLAMVPLFIALFAVRASIEERTLLTGLPGYADYTARVRYRLVPGLW